MKKFSFTQYKNKLVGDGIKIEFAAELMSSRETKGELILKYEVEDGVAPCLKSGLKVCKIGQKLTTRDNGNTLGTIEKIIDNHVYVIAD